ncbi:MAG: hypothetical protein ACR2P2_08750 [Nakamurella sp.]
MTTAQSQAHHQVAAMGAPASGRRVLGLAALVVIAAICLWVASALIDISIQTLRSSGAGAGVDAGAGSGGAAARRDAITFAVTTASMAVLVAALIEVVLPQPLGLLRGLVTAGSLAARSARPPATSRCCS